MRDHLLEREFDIALEDLRKVNNELFYDELKVILLTNTQEIESKYQEAIVNLESMRKTIDGLPFEIDGKMQQELNCVKLEFNDLLEKLQSLINFFDKQMNEEYFKVLNDHDIRVEEKYGEIVEILDEMKKKMKDLPINVSQQVQDELITYRQDFQSLFKTLQQSIDIFQKKMNDEYFLVLHQKNQEQQMLLIQHFDDVKKMAAYEISLLKKKMEESDQKRDTFYQKQTWSLRLLFVGVGILVIIECWIMANMWGY